jgi:outer membrane protein TolC
VTLQDALERAKKNDAQFLATLTDARNAHEDLVQAKAARFPTVNYRMDYLGTQGNGITPNGRFVTNDGVHVYRAWGVIHEELSVNTFMGTATQRAAAAEALAQARAEIAQRGLAVTVTKNYYAMVVAQRKYATSQQSLQQTKDFYDLTSDSERAGQTAHSDVIKAQIQYEQQQQAFEEARLAMEAARLNLAVMLFPTLNENFTVVDDLDSPRALPPFEDIQGLAGNQNPDLRVALQSQREAQLDLTAAKTAFLPKIVIEPVYGIEANAFALHSRAAAFPEVGKLPNLGYFITASMVVPVWDWGTLRSKLHQSQFRQEQARVELSQVQRQLVGNLYAAYNEASVARAAVDRLRRTADLAAESLRLVTLRYQGGASTILERVDAQNTLTASRNAYDDAQVRYRVALAALAAITGTF